MRIRVMSFIAAVGVVAGCSNPIDDKVNYLVADVPPPPAGACSKCLKVGNWYRFSELGVKDIGGAGPALVSALNGAWKQDIGKKELNIFWRVESISADGVIVKAVSGARTGTGDSSGWCLLDKSTAEIKAPFTADGQLGASAKTSMQVYAGSEPSPKNCAPTLPVHAIPVTEIEITSNCSGTCDPASADTITGTIKGGLAKAVIPSICTCVILDDRYSDSCGVPDGVWKDPDDKCNGCGPPGAVNYINLGTLITSFNGGQDINYDCKAADGGPAACLDADFTAERIETAPEPCK